MFSPSNISKEKSIQDKKSQPFKILLSRFKQVAEGKEINLETFKKILVSKNPWFVERVFKLFDKDKSGTISQSELIESVANIICKSSEEKLKFFFELNDVDGNGLISFDELRLLIKSCVDENNLEFNDEEVDQLTFILFEDADTDHTGGIDFNEMKNLLQKKPGLIDNLAMSIEKWILPPVSVQSKTVSYLSRKLQWKHIKNNLTSVSFFAFYILINIILFVTRMYSYRSQNIYVMLARGAGQCLNFNSAFVFLFILRKTITLLRTLGLSGYLPLDQHIYYHKLCGYFIFFYSILHTIMHILNFAQISKVTSISMTELLFGVSANIGWVYGTACITGWILLAILIVMILSSLPVMRKTGHFEIFFYFHLLYIFYSLFLILHGPVVWIWLLIPGGLFIFEKMIGIRSSFGSLGYTHIEMGTILPSKVIHLAIKRPHNFEFQPGDFVFVQIPSIATMEWHPFTISSAPEMEDVLWLHIRAVGQWTKRVYECFEKISYEHRSKYGQENFSIIYNDKSRPYGSIRKHLKTNLIPPTPSEVDENSNGMIDDFNSTFSTLSHKASFPKVILRKSITSHLSTRSRSVSRTTSAPIDTNTFKNRLANSSIQRFRPSSGVIIFPEPQKTESNFSVKRPISPISTKGKPEKTIIEMTSFTPLPSFWACKSELEGYKIKSKNPLVVRINGPYGSPSSNVFNSEHAVLIATGIGVTPFASILQSIMFRYIKEHQKCPKCNFSWSNPIPPSVMKLKKVDFVWINRDQKSFEWFVNLLSQLELTQAELIEKERFLDIHIYITSALDANDIKAVSLHMALDLLHDKNERDLITGLKTRTKSGRPNWEEFFDNIKETNKGRVSLFFCGPPSLGKILHNYCNNYDFTFHQEKF